MQRIYTGQISTAVATLLAQGHSTGSTLTVSTTVPSGLDCIQIDVSSQDSNDANLPITGVTVNGSAVGVVKAIEKADGTNDTCVSIWYKLAPDAGTYDIVITSTGSVFKAAVITGITGIVQQAPEATGNSSGSASSVSQSITALTSFALVIAAASHKGAYTSVSQGQTLLASEAGQSFEHVTSSYKEVNAGVNTMGQQWGSSNSFSSAAVSWECEENIIDRTASVGRTDSGTRITS